MSAIIPVIDLIRSDFPDADFYNLWQLASELKSPEVSDKKLAKIIKAMHDSQQPFQCKAEAPTYQQVQHSTFFSLQKQALEFFDQGFILVCDDIAIWERLIIATAPKQISIVLDWICKVYKHTMHQITVNALEVLNHPHLAQNQELHNLITKWEYDLRKTQKQSSNLDLPNHPLCNCLVQTTHNKDFLTIFNEIVKKLPPAIQTQTRSLIEYIPLLDGKNRCIEWFKKAVYMSICSPQVRLGIHEALKFTPSQVVFCLKHTQIRPQLSHLLFESSQKENLTEQLLQWKKRDSLNILSYSKEAIFCHPLADDDIRQKYQERKFLTSGEKPIANPAPNSRPKSISATGFNLLMQDPYGFYARYILKLNTLERITNRSPAREFGIAAHEILELLLKSGFDTALKCVDTLKLSNPVILWKTKLLRILNWVHDQINNLSPHEIQSEKALEIILLDSITVKARIDALLFLATGNLVVNFKTGTPPSKAEVINGYFPQLAIEMFLGHKIYDNGLIQAEFWQLKGTQPAGITSSSLAIPMNTLQTELEKIISHYLIRNSPFLTCPWPSKTSKCNEYKNLERLI